MSDDDLKIGANILRQVYLIFKEAINNAARHSGASQVDVLLDRADNRLTLRVTDDGRGFDASAENGGNGLTNMRKRAATLGGRLEFSSACGQGATVALSLPLDSSKPLSMLRGE